MIPYARFRLIGLAALLLHGAQAAAAVSVYTDQAGYLSALSALGQPIYHEGFEADAAWGHVRTTIVDGPAVAPAVSNLGLTWTANNLSSDITTSNGAARSGSWGLYSSPHGSYTAPDPGTDCQIPGACGDGLRGDAGTRLLLGIGGWFDTNTPFAKVGLFLGSYGGDPEAAALDQAVGTAPVFFGLIDPDGFATFEFRELEGKTEGAFDGDIKYVFADDFRFAYTTPVPLPTPVLLLGAGLAPFTLRRRRVTA